MTQHTATISPARTTYRVSFEGTLLLETDRVLELQEHFGEQTFPAVPYFDPAAVQGLGLAAAEGESSCPLKGQASYLAYRGLERAAWTYREPNPAVASIANHVAFDPERGFHIEKTTQGK